MSVSARLRVTRLTFVLLLICLTAVVPQSRAAVGFHIPISDSTGCNPFTRPITRGISYFGKRPIINFVTVQRTTTTTIDSAFTSVVFTLKVSDVPIAEPCVLNYATYESLRLAADVRSELVKKCLAGYKSTAPKAGAGEGVAIDLPYRIKSKTFRRLFGGDNVGVRVQGNVSINGSLRQQKFDELQQANMQNSNTSFRIDMVQQFTITGKIGQKVEVKVDQNSERLFDFENSLKLTYTGDEDEIVQKVEAGNVNLNLGTRLATFSGKNTGLFGLKTEAKVGSLHLTGIASLERGQKNRQSPNQTTSRAQFNEKDFIKYQYFWVSAQDTVFLNANHSLYKEVGNFRENYRHYSNRTHQRLARTQLELADIDVFVSARQQSGGDQVKFGRAASLQFYSDLARTDTFPQDGDHQSTTWKALRKGIDYTVDLYGGWIRLQQPVQVGDMVACAFMTADSNKFGTLLSSRTDTSAELQLVLLKSNDPSPTDASWNLMFRHVYSLQATNLDKNNFKLTVTRGVTGVGGRDETGPIGYNESYLTFFGFDQNGQGGTPGADGFIDDGVPVINWDFGELQFLDLTPFSPSGIFENGVLDTVGNLWVLGPSDTAGFRAPWLYTQKPTQYSDKLLWRLSTEFKGSSSVFDLGPLVLENSEEVLLNGQKLIKNVDYTIDYSSGQLRILSEAAKARGANLEITYESGKVFQLDKTTLLGARAEYTLWEDSYIGGMLLYLDQKTVDKRVRIGSEPIRNTLWDMNTSLHFKPEFLTTAMDALPLVHAEAPSQIDVDAEVARVYPNPNSLENRATGDLNGVAYLDDFEGSRRATPLGLMRRTWAISSYPSDNRIDRHRGRLRWWNPITKHQVPVHDVFPRRDVNGQVANTLQSLFMEYIPDSTTGHPEESWGGMMRYLGEGYSDQSRSQYLEFWVQLTDVEQNGPKLVVDLGTISEDAIPNDTLDTEDQPLPGTSCGPRQECGNGVLEPVEDRGLDHTSGNDPDDKAFWNGHGRDKYGNDLGPVPSWDNWSYNVGSDDPHSFDNINGTENNRNDEGGGYPDTEDLNSNDILDQTDSYYSYTIDLSSHSPFIVGNNADKQWYLYRIPIKTDDPTVRRRIGNADLTSVRWARLYLTGVRQYCKIQIVQMDIVANEWLPVTSQTDTTEYISAAVINTHENPGYRSPPGIAGEQDPITGVILREQSLVLKINRLDSAGSAAPQQFFLAKNLYQETNLTEYRHIKMFVHGGDTLEGAHFLDNKYQIILRLGQSYSLLNDNYYEIIKTVKPGWHPDNAMDIIADSLSQLHVLRGTQTGRFAAAFGQQYSGDSLAIQGNPTLARVGFIAIGVRLTNKHTSGSGDEIWVDELRLTDIYKDPGTAAQISSRITLSDVASVSGNYQITDASFHNVNTRINAGQSSNDTWQGNASINAHKFYLERFGFRLPVNMSFNRSVTTPNILPGTDTRVKASQAPDSVKSKANTFSCQAQYSKVAGSKNPFVQWTLEKLTAGWSYSRDRRSDYNTEISRTDQSDIQAAYSFPTSKGSGLAFLWFLKHAPVVSALGDTRLFFKPTKLLVSAQASKRTTYSATRPIYTLQYAGTDSAGLQVTRNITAPPRTFNTTRSLNVGFQPFEPLTIDFTRAHKARLDRGDWMNLLRYDFGQLSDINQNLQTNYSPQILPWLKPTFSHTTSYTWTNPNATTNNQQNIGNSSNFGTDFTLDFRSILGTGGAKHAPKKHDIGQDESMKSPEGMPGQPPGRDELDKGAGNRSEVGKVPPSRHVGHERGPQAGHVPPGGAEQPADTTMPGASTPAKSPSDTTKVAGAPPVAKSPSRSPLSALGSLLSPIRTVLTTIDPVALTYDNNTGHNETGTIGQANWKYQFGLSQSPGIPLASGLTTVPSLRRGIDITGRSGLRVTQDIRLAFNYAHRQSKTVAGTSSGSTEKNVFWLASKSKVTPYPFVDVTLDWAGLERLSFLSKVARTVSLSSGLSSKVVQNWTNNASNITSTQYTRSFSPLLGVTFSWKRDIESQLRYNTSSNYNDSQLAKQRQSDRQFTGQVSYTFRTGFKLPVPLIGKLRLQNQTTFSLNADYRSSKQESNERTGDPNQFSTSAQTSSWSIQPKMTYSFSTAVQGQASLQYQQTKNEITGSKQRLFEFGIQVNIAIRG